MHEFKFYASATIGIKGQIVIPQEARKELDLNEGEKVVIVKAPFHDGLLVLKADKVAEIINTMTAHTDQVRQAIEDENK